MKQVKQKLYCYVDETGQDTRGALFVVSVTVAKEDRDDLREFLAELEKTTGKGKTKWVRTRKEFKIAYLEKILTQKDFRHKIFFSLSKETKTYREVTLVTIASAITASKDQEENYEALVFIDGLQKSEVKKVATGLRRIGVHTEKVRGLRDESDEFIRLMDAIAGLIRENEEEIKYAEKLYKLGLENKTLTTV